MYSVDDEHKDRDYEKVSEYILEIPRFSKKTTLDNLRKIMKYLDKSGFEDMAIIHVAGTNGKGSVCAFVTSILLGSGYSVGTFTSPHLVNMTERIKINNIDISEDCFVEDFIQVKKAIDKAISEGGEHPSFFEVIFLMGMYEYRKQKVDYIVLETGLGGRLDATNVFAHPLVSVITSISMDHMEILGDTIEKIAYEKAGIIKKNTPVVFYGENTAVRKVIEEQAYKLTSEKQCVTKENILEMKKYNNYIAFSTDCGYYGYDDVRVKFIAEYQVVNAMIAISTIDVLIRHYNMNISRECILRGIWEMSWKARMEQYKPGVFIDGAHNAEGIDEFIKTVRDYKTSGRKLLVFSAVKEKEYDRMISDIVNLAGIDEYFIAPLHNKRALTQDILRDTFHKYVDKESVHMYSGVQEAYYAALDKKSDRDVLFCAGSLYLAGEIYGA